MTSTKLFSSADGINMTDAAKTSDKKYARWTLFCFLAFFGIIGTVDAIFIYKAVNTHTGVVTKQAYEKGLNFNETLEKARNQPNIIQVASYENDILNWQLSEQNTAPLTGATVTAKLFRPAHDGYDYEVALDHQGNGLYLAKLNLPLKGVWIAKLNSTWNNETYQTTLQFLAQ